MLRWWESVSPEHGAPGGGLVLQPGLPPPPAFSPLRGEAVGPNMPGGGSGRRKRRKVTFMKTCVVWQGLHTYFMASLAFSQEVSVARSQNKRQRLDLNPGLAA